MAKSGRPPKSDGDKGTTQVRVADDIAAMLSELALVHPLKTAQILDPLIREDVTKLHKQYSAAIQKAKAARTAAEEEMKKIREEAAQIVTGPQSEEATPTDSQLTPHKSKKSKREG